MLMIERGHPLFAVNPITSKVAKPTKHHQKVQKKETMIEQCDPLSSEILEWLHEFGENLVDDEIPVHGDSHASFSHEVSLEPTLERREDLVEHSVEAHFP